MKHCAADCCARSGFDESAPAMRLNLPSSLAAMRCASPMNPPLPPPTIPQRIGLLILSLIVPPFDRHPQMLQQNDGLCICNLLGSDKPHRLRKAHFQDFDI